MLDLLNDKHASFFLVHAQALRKLLTNIQTLQYLSFHRYFPLPTYMNNKSTSLLQSCITLQVGACGIRLWYTSDILSWIWSMLYLKVSSVPCLKLKLYHYMWPRNWQTFAFHNYLICFYLSYSSKSHQSFWKFSFHLHDWTPTIPKFTYVYLLSNDLK